MHQALRDAQITFEYQHYLPFRGCGLESETAHAFADFALPTPWGYVLLEADEEQHKAYDPSCDVRRNFDMAASVAHHQEGAPRSADPPAGELLAREPEAPFTRLFLFHAGPRRTTRCPVWDDWSEPVRAVSRCA